MLCMQYRLADCCNFIQGAYTTTCRLQIPSEDQKNCHIHSENYMKKEQYQLNLDIEYDFIISFRKYVISCKGM